MSRTVTLPAYTVGANACAQFPAVCAPLGRRFLLIGGKTALQSLQPRLHAATAGSPMEQAACVVFSGDCTEAQIAAVRDRARALDVDFIVAAGGGKALDTGKAAGFAARLPVVTIPTIAATCAGITKLAVVYRDDHSFSHFAQFEHPPAHCIVDTAIIAAAPERYLRAGMGDTLAKHFEPLLASRGDRLGHSSLLGISLCAACRQPVLEYGVAALSQCQQGVAGQALEEVALANIVSTGLVSILVEECYNCAVAHSLFYALAALDGFEERNLHGDAVAWGVLVQLAVEGRTEELAALRPFMQMVGMPVRLWDMGVRCDPGGLAPVLQTAVAGPDMAHLPYQITEEMLMAGIRLIESM